VEKYNFLKLFTFLRATLQLARAGRLRFKVTPKRADEGIRAQERRLLAPNVALVVGELVAGLVGIANLLRGVAAGGRHDIVYVAQFWALVNALLAGLIVRSIARRVYRRQSHRFPVPLAARLEAGDGPPQVAGVSDISLAGIGLRAPAALPRDAAVRLALHLPAGPVALRGRVVASRPLPDGSTHLGLRLAEVAGDDRRRLVTFLYVTAPRLWYRRGGADGAAPTPRQLVASARSAEGPAPRRMSGSA
jgi:hypothetical protein